MRKIQTLIFIGCISFTGFVVHAQPGTTVSTDSMLRDLLGGDAMSNVVSISDMFADTSGAAQMEEATSVLDGPLTVTAAPPEVNVTTVDALDARTGRYPPRLKINFAEFPLRSLESANRSNNGRNAGAKTQADVVVQRIQSRFQLPQLDLVVKDRTAIISGTVETERQRDIIATMLCFEPGISIVQNNLIVVPTEGQ